MFTFSFTYSQVYVCLMPWFCVQKVRGPIICQLYICVYTPLRHRLRSLCYEYLALCRTVDRNYLAATRSHVKTHTALIKIQNNLAISGRLVYADLWGSSVIVLCRFYNICFSIFKIYVNLLVLHAIYTGV